MSTTTQQHTVMVIEDEEAFIDALVVGLQREGFGVEVARDGAEALSKDRKSTRLNSSHVSESRMPSSA